MDYSIFIFFTFVVTLSIFNKKINKYINQKLKSILNIDEELLKKKQEENTLFQRDELSNSTQTKTFINPTTFKPKIAKSLILLFFSFVVVGIAFTYIATKEDTSAGNFFPLIFTIYGTVLLLKFYSTKYKLDNSGLKVSSLFIPIMNILQSKLIKKNS